MKNIIKDIILENQSLQSPEFISREIDIPNHLDIIISVIGPRRSGKTYLLFQCISELLDQGVDKENIVYINFEDERLNISQNELDVIIQAYIELFPEIKISNSYFFFDEIQNVTGWEKFVRRIFDTKTKHIFITGSNSKLLSTEIATELRGRTLSISVYPLSFSEYLDFNSVNKQLHPQQNRAKIIHYAKKFLLNGGFPELVFFDDSNRRMMLQQYYNVMIFRDIVERYNITNIEILKFFIKKIFAGVTKPFSVNKAYNDLKSMAYKISNKYLYDYFEYCNAIFLCLSISKFDYSEIKQAKSDKKAYIIDNGLLHAVEFSMSKNLGKLLENLVIMEFFKAGKQLFYYKNNYECDLIVNNKNRLFPIQISYEVNDELTLQREINGLVEACNYLNLKNGTIISFDTENTVKYNNIDIEIIPFYKYFLSYQ